MAEDLTGLSGVWTSKNLGLAFQLSNGAEVKKTVVRTNWDHVGNIPALGHALLKKIWAVRVFATLLFGQEDKVGDFCFQPR